MLKNLRIRLAGSDLLFLLPLFIQRVLILGAAIVLVKRT